MLPGIESRISSRGSVPGDQFPGISSRLSIELPMYSDRKAVTLRLRAVCPLQVYLVLKPLIKDVESMT